LIIILCMAAVGVPVGVWLWGDWLPAVLTVEAALIGAAIGALVVQAAGAPTLRRALAARGQSPELPMTLRQTTEGLVQDLGDVVMTARWTCVTDLYATRKHWVFLVQSSAMVLPRRFFSSPETERAFIATALSRMPDTARVRSPDAVGFVGE